jgi:ABC-type branched-subunit amino acid transport system ATPase component
MDLEPLLEVSDIRKHFAGVVALDGVSVSVPAGMIYGLIGPNGSGKTTLFNVMTGFTRPDRGGVVFAGRSLVGLAPYEIARLGLIRTFQSSLAPERMTVMENMLLAPQRQLGDRIVNLFVRPGDVGREERRHLDRARQLLEIVNLAGKSDDYAGSLSGGQKKLLALAQALMAEPRLVLLDEPVAGVNPRLIKDIAAVIQRLRHDGQNFLIVEHNMAFIRMICDRVSVLDAGQVIAEGAAEEVLSREDVLHAYLGRRRGNARERTAS